MKTASLKPGVLLKLLDEMAENDQDSSPPINNINKPSLLQVRSIVPVMAEGGDLWPNKGFYLKVSDSSHAIFVSLPQHLDDLILRNDLKLGQYIYVDGIQSSPSHPVPVLRGVTPVPGRHPCVGSPEEVAVIGTDSVALGEGTDLDSATGRSGSSSGGGGGRRRTTAAKRRSASFSVLWTDGQVARAEMIDCIEKKCVSEKRVAWSSAEKESDSDSPKSTTVNRRRSWNDTKPSSCRSRSASVSPVRSHQCHSSDDNLSSTNQLIRTKTHAMRSRRNSSKSKVPSPMKGSELATWNAVCTKSASASGTKILWDNLPSNLVNAGKEVVKKRDAAMVAAVEALQEAAAAERLIRCLSTFSEFQEEKKQDDRQQQDKPSVERFLNLQDYLTHTRLIIQSLTCTPPLGNSNADLAAAAVALVKETPSLAVERKKNATLWLKAIISSDIPPFPDPSRPVTAISEGTKRTKKSRYQQPTLPKASRSSVGGTRKKSVTSEIIPVGLAIHDNGILPCWRQGSVAPAAVLNMTESLQEACQKWFLGYLERILDGTAGKAISREVDGEVAEMMCQIKRVNDWLDMVAAGEGGRNCSSDENVRGDGYSMGIDVDDSASEACARVKNKIYRVLLEHVERTAMQQFGIDQQ